MSSDIVKDINSYLCEHQWDFPFVEIWKENRCIATLRSFHAFINVHIYVCKNNLQDVTFKTEINGEKLEGTLMSDGRITNPDILLSPIFDNLSLLKDYAQNNDYRWGMASPSEE